MVVADSLFPELTEELVGERRLQSAGTRRVTAEPAVKLPRARGAFANARYKGGRNVNPLANNSSGVRGLLQPDPWSASPRGTTQGWRPRAGGEGGTDAKALFGTYTSNHSSCLVWLDTVQGPSGLSWNDAGEAEAGAAAASDCPCDKEPKALNEHLIKCQVAREWSMRHPPPSASSRRPAYLEQIRGRHSGPRPGQTM
eukprot:TRINITY_DN14772_c0_g1_i1.p1 TRINITY_DN14772_c0_g1~~TRINITY_DN14772_c0_g1_i1.p1  ORF type:complete len:217 (-),score=23.58 TRINITY_DN14772_c0_g1_i1:323-916(-)